MRRALALRGRVPAAQRTALKSTVARPPDGPLQPTSAPQLSTAAGAAAPPPFNRELSTAAHRLEEQPNFASLIEDLQRKEAKHVWNRNWEEAKNEVDMKRNARDCYAEREDLWKQVEGMEALRETNNHLRHALKATDQMMEMANRDAKRMLESIRAKTKETEALLKAEREYLQTIEGRLAFDSDYPWPSMEALAAAKCTRHALTLTIVNLEADVAWLHALKRMAESGWPG